MNDTPKKTLSIARQPGANTPTLRGGKRIIRREDLPQVQPPGKPKSATAATKAPKKKPPRKQQPKKPVVSPSDLKARELNDRLNGFSVWLHYQPLALGIDKDLFRLVNDEHFPGASKKVVQKVMRMHTNHGLYLQAILQHDVRYRLDGTEEGATTPQQKQLAADTLAKRQTSS